MSEAPVGARVIEPLVAPPDATVVVPGSKSITNRALLLAAGAQGASTITGALDADDTEAMVDGLRTLGATIEARDGALQVTPGAPPPGASTCQVDARLSGTTSRFLLPAAACAGRPVVVDGLPPLRARPMGPLLRALEGLGAQVDELGEPGCLPVRIDGRRLHGGRVEVAAHTSSQFLSALLLSAPGLAGGLEVEVPGAVVARPFVTLTLELLRAFGATADEVRPGRFRVEEGGLRGRAFDVEPDATAASYFFAAAAITGGRVTVPGLGRSSTQGDLAFLDVLREMGAKVRRGERSIEVEGDELRGVDVDLSAIPDTAQTFAAVAVHAEGPSRVRGVGFIRRHETDRLAAVVAELRRLGIDAAETEDGFTIEPGRPVPGTVRTYDDHRMAMSFALLGLRNPGIAVAHPEVVAKTYPTYFEDLERLRT